MNSNTLTLNTTKSYLLVIAIVLPLLVGIIIFFLFFSKDSISNNEESQVNETNQVNEINQANVNGETSEASESVLPDSFYNYAYGEIFIAYRSGTNITLEVFNTTGVEDYSQIEWDMLDVDEIATELGAARVVINHPQYWVVDSVVGFGVDGSDIKIDDINLQKINEIETSIFGANISNSPYTENTLESNAEFTWNSGTEIYELTSPSGDVYRMRSYSQSIDSTIELNSLDSLSDKLDLPNGWEFSSRVLETESAYSGNEITLIGDDLGNSYLLIN